MDDNCTLWWQNVSRTVLATAGLFVSFDVDACSQYLDERVDV